MYKSGIGVGADLNKAIALMNSAQESGFPLAAVALSSMTDPAANPVAETSEKPAIETSATPK
jgi:TPR repeat protein